MAGGVGPQALDAVEALVRKQRPMARLAAGQPGGLRRRLAARVFAGQEPHGEREIGHDAQPEAARGRHHLGLDGARQQVPFVLRGHEARQAVLLRQPEGVGDLPAGVVRAAAIADLALVDQPVERVQGLVERRHGVGRVVEIEVDVVAAQPFQAALAGAHDVAARAAREVAPVTGGLHAEFGDHHRLGPPRPQRPPQNGLRGAVVIHVGGVEQGDAGVEGRRHHLAALGLVDPPAQRVAAQPGQRGLQARTAETAQFHGFLPAAGGDDSP